jgi:hypothetical protein
MKGAHMLKAKRIEKDITWKTDQYKARAILDKADFRTKMTIS